MIAMGMAILLALTALLALLMWGAIWAMNLAMRKMVGEKHHDLETIVETGQVPLGWRVPFERRIARLGEGVAGATRRVEIQRQARESHLKRLAGLVRYVRACTLVDGEETRLVLLEKLAQADAAWRCEGERPDGSSGQA